MSSGEKDRINNKLPTILLKKNLKVVKNVEYLKRYTNMNSIYKEDVIYESKFGDFLKQDTEVTLINRLNLITNGCHTVARYGKEPVVEKTSENIIRLIGQKNYDTLFSALCSVISQELKIRGILSLLSEPKKCCSVSCQTETKTFGGEKYVEDKSCQTEETRMGLIYEKKPKKRNRRQQLTPYVVTETKKKVKHIISPITFKDFTPLPPDEDMTQSLLKSPPLLLDDNSKDSIGQCSTLTVNTWPELLDNPMGLLEDIQKVTKPVETDLNHPIDWGNGTKITLLDNTIIKIPLKIEDCFHIATPEVIKYVAPELRRKVLWYQAYIDWKLCLTPDEENNLPIHQAAINGDVDMLRRHCVVLKTRHESVDIPTVDNMTALQISIYRNHAECTAMLLHFGADAFTSDEEDRSCFHLAAEADPGHLNALIKHCDSNPMEILQENFGILKAELACKPKDYLTKYLLRKISVMFDNQGYTPLMLACKAGKHENVKILLEAIPLSANVQMPNSGDTALFIAVSAACSEYIDGKNKSMFDDFKKVIELLIENGADTNIQNHSGCNVNTILTDLKVCELSTIIAEKMISFFDGKVATSSNKYDNLIIVKTEDDSSKIASVREEKTYPKDVKVDKSKLVILENIRIDHKTLITNKTSVPPKTCVLKKETGQRNETPDTKVTVDIKNEAKQTLFMNSFKEFIGNNFDVKMKSSLSVSAPVTELGHAKAIVKEKNASKVLNSQGTQEVGSVIVKVSSNGEVTCSNTSKMKLKRKTDADVTNVPIVDAKTSKKRKEMSDRRNKNQ